jgi:hypothetical protein
MPHRTKEIVLRAGDAERFWPKVDKRGPDECWPWNKTITANGCGVFMSKATGKKTVYIAYRVAWYLANGRQPIALVCHHCDNRECCNPDHLFEGNQRDNMRDMNAKKRAWFQRVTHCRHGHPLSGDNVRVNCAGSRVCQTCRRATNKRHRERKKNPALKAWMERGL